MAAATREYLKRRDELFRRVRPLALYHLLVDNEEAVESIYDIPEKEEEKSERPATVAVVHDADEVVEVDKVRFSAPLTTPRSCAHQLYPLAAVFAPRRARRGGV